MGLARRVVGARAGALREEAAAGVAEVVAEFRSIASQSPLAMSKRKSRTGWLAGDGIGAARCSLSVARAVRHRDAVRGHGGSAALRSRSVSAPAGAGARRAAAVHERGSVGRRSLCAGAAASRRRRVIGHDVRHAGDALLMQRADVAIIGGGPGGSSAAAFLAERGLSVALFERETFPRFHVGESLMPATMLLLQELGVRQEIDARGFQLKYGAPSSMRGRITQNFNSGPGAWPTTQTGAEGVRHDTAGARTQPG